MIVTTVVLGTLKLSILSLYARMTPVASHRLTLYILMGFVVAHDVAALFPAIFACSPISEYWDLDSYTIFENPACIKVLPFDIFNSAWSAMEDVVLWILPIPILWGLNVSLRRKMGLYLLIAVSAVSVVCAIVRVAVTIVWIRSVDISWNYPLIPLLTNVEACVAIVTSSMPAIQLLFKREPRLQPADAAPSPPKYQPPLPSDSLESQDSETAVPSTSEETDKRSSHTWSLLSRLRPTSGVFKQKMFSQRHPPTFRSEDEMMTGPRTELKEIEEDGDVNFIPGLPSEKTLQIK